MIAIYWETVARWINMRAKRVAKALKVPLYLIQSADSSSPRMSVDKAKKLMNRANPRNTGGMHGMLAVHVGMKIRLLEAQDLNNGYLDTKAFSGDSLGNPILLLMLISLKRVSLRILWLI